MHRVKCSGVLAFRTLELQPHLLVESSQEVCRLQLHLFRPNMEVDFYRVNWYFCKFRAWGSIFSRSTLLPWTPGFVGSALGPRHCRHRCDRVNTTLITPLRGDVGSSAMYGERELRFRLPLEENSILTFWYYNYRAVTATNHVIARESYVMSKMKSATQMWMHLQLLFNQKKHELWSF